MQATFAEGEGESNGWVLVRTRGYWNVPMWRQHAGSVTLRRSAACSHPRPAGSARAACRDWIGDDPRVPLIARVLPLVPARGMPGVLDYAEPTGAPVGTVVQIPLGSRTVDGIIVERASESEIPAERLKAVSAVEPRSTTEELVQVLAGWRMTWPQPTARALQLVAPPVQQARQRLWAYPEVEAVPEEERLTEAQRELLAALIASGARPAERISRACAPSERRGLCVSPRTDERRAPPRTRRRLGLQHAPA